VTWNSLRHPNILLLLGVTMVENRFVMVSEWMESGSITEFVKANAAADRLKLVCLSSKSLLLLTVDDRMITAAQRRH
jgi:serine/threonine protein kinase